jgi:amino acid transporter
VAGRVAGRPAGTVGVASEGGRLRWWDGFVLALTMPAALIATLGYSVGALGAWAAVVLWGISMLIATAANWLYAELAGMFPGTSGGISLYAAEGWRSRLPLLGPLGAFGYWFAWSSSLAVYAEIIGAIVHEQWWSGASPDAIAAATLVAVWLPNILGIRPTIRLARVTAAMLLVPLAVLCVGPWLSGDWQASNLSWGLGHDGLKVAIVWLYVMLWTSLGVETCATFAPEYRDPVRDTARALRASALFSLVVFVLLPLGTAGVVGERAAVEDPVGFYATALEAIVPGLTDVMLVLVVGGLVLVMNTCLADSSRALYGVAEAGMTVSQLAHRNRFGAPDRCLSVDLVVNLALVLVVGSLLAILAAGNLGYLLSHVLALSAFVLLRRDRPRHPRPIRGPAGAVWLAGALAIGLTLVLVVGAASFDITGYGGAGELLIALGVLSISLVLYAVRQAQAVRPVIPPPPPTARPAPSGHGGTPPRRSGTAG